MAARITDYRRKKIIADYLELESYRAVAKKNGVSAGTVKAIVSKVSGFEQKLAQKKDKNTQEMLAYMDARKGEAQKIIDLYLKELQKPEKMKDATLAQVATAMGIIVDKFTRNTASGGEKLNKLDSLLEEFRNAVESETD